MQHAPLFDQVWQSLRASAPLGADPGHKTGQPGRRWLLQALGRLRQAAGPCGAMLPCTAAAVTSASGGHGLSSPHRSSARGPLMSGPTLQACLNYAHDLCGLWQPLGLTWWQQVKNSATNRQPFPQGQGSQYSYLRRSARFPCLCQIPQRPWMANCVQLGLLEPAAGHVQHQLPPPLLCYSQSSLTPLPAATPRYVKHLQVPIIVLHVLDWLLMDTEERMCKPLQRPLLPVGMLLPCQGCSEAVTAMQVLSNA